ncbi:protein FAR-RED IMPAIRED RESPONSE 1-like [Syzygium oleosum]|uniref:protein FAR-RED IMPAIRED RESPONSE 1-like n=1 Tax=Syzygium oleosum TaxID=219896 RepID=UPI0024BA5CC4|nr:protein FAR-RED IMPAIRED RESPONSE 1-like [Syzygium oleosum]
MVFPNTQHRLCTWHIGKNANQNIPHLYHKPGFKDKYFLALMYRCKSEDEFEATWREMEEVWGTKNNKWLQRLYDLRYKWSSAFGHDSFTCGIRSTQRSESTNNVFRHMSTKTLSLVEFVHHYEEQLKHMREVESQYDYSSRGTAKLKVNNGILSHATSVYTRTIFERFNEEFLHSLSEHISSTTFDGSVSLYTLKCMGIGSQGEYVVRFDSADFSVSCECKLFESKGWLCRHALCVLNVNMLMVTVIPSSYILKRWTKDAKEGIVNDESHQMSPGPSKFNRFSTLMHESIELMSMGAEDVDTMRILRKHMVKAKAEISSYKSSMVVIDDAGDDEDNEALCDISVADPIRRKRKGISYGRLKSSSEKKKKKSKKGTPPTQIVSQELVVQATPNEARFPDCSSNSNQFRSVFYPSNIGGPTQPPFIMPSRIMSGFCAMQSPYVMLPRSGFSPFTSQMLEYHNQSHGTILSQGSSNSFQHPGMNESESPFESIDNAQSQHK